MANPNLKNESPTLLKITSKDDETEELKHKTEKHDFENILKSPKNDNNCYKKKNRKV